MKYILVNIPCYVLVFLLSALKPLQLHIPVTGPFEQQRLNHRAICRTKSPRMETGKAAFLPQELLLTRDVTSNAGNNGPFVGSRLVLM